MKFLVSLPRNAASGSFSFGFAVSFGLCSSLAGWRGAAGSPSPADSCQTLPAIVLMNMHMFMLPPEKSLNSCGSAACIGCSCQVKWDEYVQDGPTADDRPPNPVIPHDVDLAPNPPKQRDSGDHRNAPKAT